MAESLGSGVSRTLSAIRRQFDSVVWQASKPPLDAEINLVAAIANEQRQNLVRSVTHSGFFLDPTRACADYVVDPQWSNFFLLGRQADGEDAPIIFANVNGWVIPVTGTLVPDGDTSNQINLNPPPDSDARIDLVFLEVWSTLVAPNPSEENKPSASTLWTVGNVEFGGTNITDDLEDPTIGYETTERVQVQYRIRVFGAGAGLGSSVALDVYPDGLDDPNVLGQGTATEPVAGMSFTNMREELGDPSLWRAGDGDSTNDLGTVGGYVYAIPIAAVFRRNTSPFEAIEPSGAANQNGGLNRNPSASSLIDPRDGAKALNIPTLTNDIAESTVGALAITGLADSGFDDPDIDLGSTFLVIDDEVIGPITAVGGSTITIGAGARGRNGTDAVPHDAGSTVKFYNPRPDGLFADQIATTDILDLRRGVTVADWDYQRLLVHNLTKNVQGTLRTSYKQSAIGDTEGIQVIEVSYLLADGATAVPPSSVAVDGPDGVRTVWSDAAAIQPGVTVLCDAPTVAGTVVSLDAGVSWEVAADFQPSGFITGAGYANGSVVFLNIGGSNGASGARGTFRDAGTYAVRFVSPWEYWKTDLPNETTGLQFPIQVRFLEAGTLQPAAYGESTSAHPGPMYPLRALSFESPFIVLGGVLNSSCSVGGVTVHNDSPGAGEYEVDLPGFDFNTGGLWYPAGDVTSLDPTGLTFPVLRGQRTLFDMLTQGGKDRTGRSSEVYLILYGDTANPDNNGAFQVIGAGTAGYTTSSASAADRIRVRFLSAGISAFSATANTYTAEIRSQYTNVEDGTGGSASPPASLALVFTDIEGTISGKWSGSLTAPVSQKMVVTTTLQYHPGRGATARVADSIWRVAGISLGAEYLRQAPGSIDATFPTAAGVPANETYFDPSHVQTWNRLPSLGMSAPDAPAYGGGIANFSEQTRESESFVDRGSKSLIFRPFLDRSMTLQARTSSAAVGDTLLGAATYPGPVPTAGTIKDGAAIWTTGLHMGFEVPPEFMPRFGRQDIPYNDGSGTFLAGFNHLFTDSTDVSEEQFYIIGGQDSTNATIKPMYVQTGASSGFDYGEYGTITGPSTPAYQGRLYSSTTVISSDLGRGMRGIQLPPYIGIARLYGVYDRRDYVAKGGSTFNSDRTTPAADPATNLLLTGAAKQTLFILQGGASDITGDSDDHTYIVPEDAMDIRLSPTYVDGETFTDLDYVVEFCCFGFARGFINLNNYVLCRRHKGSATLIADGDDPEADGARMTIPAPAPSGDALYIGATRTPYQGDPYMTRAGETRTVTDYTARYGQVPIASQYKLNTSIQQFDADGDLIPETPNRRALQVLAALDFYTTLGTGKMGGSLYAGTPTDVGYTEDTALAATRLPESPTAPTWRVLPRAYSEGQRETTSRASVGVEIALNGSVAGESVTITVPGQTPVTLEAGVDFAVGANATITAQNLAAAINADTTLPTFVSASNTGTTVCTIQAQDVGAVGNEIAVSITDSVAYNLITTQAGDRVVNLTSTYLTGGIDLNVNAGIGTSQIDLTGMTERLPLGILLQDSDFLCENPLNDNASAMATQPLGIQPVQSILPLASGGSEYTRFLGGPGQWVGMSDGGVLLYEAYDSVSAPTGTKRYRIFRGGGAAFVLSNPVPGGPVDWVAGSFPASFSPVLKGGILACKALLVRNLPEEAFSTPRTTTQGDELQMVVLTYGILGNGDSLEDGIKLEGVISPTGYGEGYAAADRYRIEGRPMVMGRARKIDTFDAEPAVFPGRED